MEFDNIETVKRAVEIDHGIAIVPQATVQQDGFPAVAKLFRTAAEAEDLFQRFHRMVVDGDASQADGLGKLAVLKGVADFPTRVKCASLAWHTLRAALKGDAAASTE